MKKTILLLFTVLFVAQFTHAQEKQTQSGPTKNETIRWINTYADAFYHKTMIKYPKNISASLNVNNKQASIYFAISYIYSDGSGSFHVNGNLYLARIKTMKLNKIVNEDTHYKPF